MPRARAAARRVPSVVGVSLARGGETCRQLLGWKHAWRGSTLRRFRRGAGRVDVQVKCVAALELKWCGASAVRSCAPHDSSPALFGRRRALVQVCALGDPHRVLGVEPGADEATIKKAFRRLALRCGREREGDATLAATSLAEPETVPLRAVITPTLATRSTLRRISTRFRRRMTPCCTGRRWRTTTDASEWVGTDVVATTPRQHVQTRRRWSRLRRPSRTNSSRVAGKAS